MDNQRLQRVLIILLIILAALYLAQMIWNLVSGYADLLLLFLLSWLVSFVLSPLVFQVSERPIPHTLIRFAKPLMSESLKERLLRLHIPRGAAVGIVYLDLLIVVVLVTAIVAPMAITQSSQLASRLPAYMARAPEASAWAQHELARLGLNVKIQDAITGSLNGLQGYATALIANALGIFTGVLGILTNVVVVLILGFYITLDGPRMRHALMRVVPTNYQDEIQFLGKSIDRTFGGFIRGQLIQSLLQMFGTALVMSLMGLNFALVASLFAGLFMLIPLVGPFLALLPPLLVVLLQAPDLAIWLFVVLFVYQFVIVNILMPRVMSDAVGLHPLLVFGAILISVKVAGFWGAFFGVPVAGVLWAMAMFFFGEWLKEGSAGARRAETADEDID